MNFLPYKHLHVVDYHPWPLFRHIFQCKYSVFHSLAKLQRALWTCFLLLMKRRASTETLQTWSYSCSTPTYSERVLKLGGGLGKPRNNLINQRAAARSQGQRGKYIENEKNADIKPTTSDTSLPLLSFFRSISISGKKKWHLTPTYPFDAHWYPNKHFELFPAITATMPTSCNANFEHWYTAVDD